MNVALMSHLVPRLFTGNFSGNSNSQKSIFSLNIL